jgi:hypothetical protein
VTTRCFVSHLMIIDLVLTQRRALLVGPKKDRWQSKRLIWMAELLSRVIPLTRFLCIQVLLVASDDTRCVVFLASRPFQSESPALVDLPQVSQRAVPFKTAGVSSIGSLRGGTSRPRSPFRVVAQTGSGSGSVRCSHVLKAVVLTRARIFYVHGVSTPRVVWRWLSSSCHAALSGTGSCARHSWIWVSKSTACSDTSLVLAGRGGQESVELWRPSAMSTVL